MIYYSVLEVRKVYLLFRLRMAAEKQAKRGLTDSNR